MRVDAAEGREGIGALAPGPSAGPRSRRARAAREPVREARRGRSSGGIRTVRSVSEEVRGSSRRGRLDHRRRHGSCGCYGSCWERVRGGSGRRVRSYRAAGVGILNWTQSEFRRGKMEMMSSITPRSRRVRAGCETQEQRRKIRFTRSRGDGRDRIGARSEHPVANRRRRAKHRAVGSRKFAQEPHLATLSRRFEDLLCLPCPCESPSPALGSARFYCSALGRCEAPDLSHSRGVLGHAATQAERRAL